MTPDEYRAWRKAYDAKRYVTKIKPERAAKRVANLTHAETVAYRRGFAAGRRRAAKDAAQSFAGFTQPTTNPEH